MNKRKMKRKMKDQKHDLRAMEKIINAEDNLFALTIKRNHEMAVLIQDLTAERDEARTQLAEVNDQLWELKDRFQIL